MKLLLWVAILAALLLGAGSVPWTSRTEVDVSVVDEAGSPLSGARVSLVSVKGGVLADGITNREGILVLEYSPDSDTDWGKFVWRFDFYLDGYVADETPVRIAEKKAGSVRGWLPWLESKDDKPHLLFLIQARVICKKIT